MEDLRLSDELIALLGEPDFVRLVEAYGGIRLYVPVGATATQLSEALGETVAARLATRYACCHIRVPLARDLRARHYREAGLSNAEIARKLGITESGVVKLFGRTPKQYRRKRADPRQIDLFPTD